MVSIRPFSKEDFPRVKAIYQQGIDTGLATFQTKAKEWDEWDSGLLPDCRLVAVVDHQVVGWAALSSVSNRCVYAGVAEVTVYVATEVSGKGIGSALLTALVEASENTGIWTLQAGIFSENKASIALHEKHGFTLLGIRKKLGKLHGEWKDIAFMERRSNSVGVE